MIANCDQWVDIKIDDYLSAAQSNGVDGMIMSMTANHKKWSYLKINCQGQVQEVREKRSYF